MSSVDQAVDSEAAEVSTLQRELRMLERQTNFEAACRVDLQNTLGREMQLPLVPLDHQEALRRREDEIRMVKQECATMTEYLRRGVEEATRATAAVSELSEQYRIKHEAVNELAEDRARLREIVHELSVQIEETKGSLAKLSEQKEYFESHKLRNEHFSITAQDLLSLSHENVAKLSREAERLRNQARTYETIERATECLAAAARRCAHAISLIQRNVSLGGKQWFDHEWAEMVMDPTKAIEEYYNDEESDDGYDSGEDADPTMYPPAVAVSVCSKAGEAESMLLSLWTMLHRFEFDEAQRQTVARLRHNELLEEMRRDLQETVERCSYHIRSLEETRAHREPLLVRYSQVRAHALQQSQKQLLQCNDSSSSEDILRAATSMEEPFSLLDYLRQENDVLSKEHNVLFSENMKLHRKTSSMESDYQSVRELKHTYRELEMRKTLLSCEIRERESENKVLKEGLWAMTEAASLANPAAIRAGRGNSPRVGRPPWRVPSEYS